jgi:hypothetical protein
VAEYPQAGSGSSPTARKEHKCCECHGVIPIGEKYHLYSGIWDGSAAAYKTCAECEVLRKYVSDTIRDYDERPGFGELCEFVFEIARADWIRRYIDIGTARGVVIPQWMPRRLAKEVEAEKERAA